MAIAFNDGDEEEIQATMERFRREVLTMAQVRHPNILQVYDQDRANVFRLPPEKIILLMD
jgi:serine/threonine protein kinase